MAASPREISDTELIQEEMAQARRALDRYHQLTTADYLAQQERLSALEHRIEKLERSTESLRQEITAVVDSKIWRTLVRGGSFIKKMSGSRSSGT